MIELGKVVDGPSNGYAVRECFTISDKGDIVPCGYAVCGSSGEILQKFSSLEAAQNHLQALIHELNDRNGPGSGPGM